MHGALFALPCPACGGALEIQVPSVARCRACDRSYHAAFGYLILVSHEVAGRDSFGGAPPISRSRPTT
jgi:hypothetical protein